MRQHEATLKSGITRTPEFTKKGLAQFAVNVGTKCGHDCLYCSTGALLRMHDSFKAAGENPFQTGYSIVDPKTPERVRAAAKGMQDRGLIQLCTTVDAWAPEAQEHNLGRRCLEAILPEPGWTVRILTKNAAVATDFDLIEQYRDRVTVGISLTGTATKSQMTSLIEPNASTIPDRMAALQEANRRGLRTFAMLCPLMPGISTSEEDLEELVAFSVSHRAEEIFAEPINGRGPGLKRVEEVLRATGYQQEADAVGAVRKASGWSTYTTLLLRDLRASLERHGYLERFRFLLYPGKLVEKDRSWIQTHMTGVKWLEKEPKVA